MGPHHERQPSSRQSGMVSLIARLIGAATTSSSRSPKLGSSSSSRAGSSASGRPSPSAAPRAEPRPESLRKAFFARLTETATATSLYISARASRRRLSTFLLNGDGRNSGLASGLRPTNWANGLRSSRTSSGATLASAVRRAISAARRSALLRSASLRQSTILLLKTMSATYSTYVDTSTMPSNSVTRKSAIAHTMSRIEMA